MKIINKTKNTILAEDAAIADTLLKRMKGLLGKKEFEKGVALVIKPCNSVHTFFMHFPIDLIFVNSENHVVKTVSNLNPWRISGIYFSAQSCIELPAGTIRATFTSSGDILSIS